MGRDLLLADEAHREKYGEFRRSARSAASLVPLLRVLDASLRPLEDALLGRGVDRPLDRPVLVTGNYRSGTTFVESVLAAHPALATFTYISQVLPTTPRLGELLARIVPGFDGTMVPAHQPNLEIDIHWPYEGETLWRHCRSNPFRPGLATDVLDADFADAAFERRFVRAANKHLAVRGRTRFLTKNPLNTIRMGFLGRMLPDARFVHLVRHPHRVLRSQLDMEAALARAIGPTNRDLNEVFSELFFPPRRRFPRLPRTREMEALVGADPAHAGALFVADVDDVADAEIRRLGDRVFVLRYEDLLEDPDGRTRALLAFAELEEHGEAVLDAVRSGIDAALVSRRTPLPRFAPHVEAVLRPIAARHGYAPIEASAAG